MPDTTPGEYFVIKDGRIAVDIDDTIDDEEIKVVGDEVNRDFESDIFPFAESLPLTGELLKDGKSAVLLLFRSRWKAKKKDFDEAKYWEEQYRKKLERIIKAFQAVPTTRTKRVSVGTDYKTRLLFSQIKKF